MSDTDTMAEIGFQSIEAELENVIKELALEFGMSPTLMAKFAHDNPDEFVRMLDEQFPRVQPPRLEDTTQPKEGFQAPVPNTGGLAVENPMQAEVPPLEAAPIPPEDDGPDFNLQKPLDDFWRGFSEGGVPVPAPGPAPSPVTPTPAPFVEGQPAPYGPDKERIFRDLQSLQDWFWGLFSPEGTPEQPMKVPVEVTENGPGGTMANPDINRMASILAAAGAAAGSTPGAGGIGSDAVASKVPVPIEGAAATQNPSWDLLAGLAGVQAPTPPAMQRIDTPPAPRPTGQIQGGQLAAMLAQLLGPKGFTPSQLTLSQALK